MFSFSFLYLWKLLYSITLPSNSCLSISISISSARIIEICEFLYSEPRSPYVVMHVFNVWEVTDVSLSLRLSWTVE